MTTRFAPGFWGRILGGGSKWELEIHSPNSKVVLSDGEVLRVPTSLLENATIEHGLLWAAISFPFENEQACLLGLRNEHADGLVNAARLMEQRRKQEQLRLREEQRRKEEEERARELALKAEEKRLRDEMLRHEFEQLRPHLLALDGAIAELTKRERYIRGYDIRHLLQAVQSDAPQLPRISYLLTLDALDGAAYDPVRTLQRHVASFVQAPHEGIARWNEKFVEREKSNPVWKKFFKNIESSELNPEQEEAVVVHEDRNRLVAAAGSGKSSTLVAKAGYSIKKGYVTPEQVLALAFNKKAAEEIRNRLETRIGIAIKAKTFHSLGKEIVESASGRKCVLASTKRTIQKIITELSNSDANFLTNLLLFKAVHWQTEPEREFSSVEEYEDYIRSKGRKSKDREEWGVPSLRGEPVRSYEELAIANWLFVHGVAYKYEPPYEHDVKVHGWNKYEPDFVYELADGTRIYHEHFALRLDKTSPFGASYVKSANDKRSMHKHYGTVLIETTSGQFQDGTVFEHLMAELESRGVEFHKKSQEALKECLKERNDRDLVRLMSALISHGKESGYDERHFRQQAKKQRDFVRAKLFLDLLFPVWWEYEEVLQRNGSIDFADMIGLATKIAEEPNFESNAKLILVDEFQDISPGRAKLVKALLAKHPDSVLFGVGDDWQAINRFAGSDLSIMREFEAYFGKTETRRLSTTFRSNQGISNVSARFVMKNGAQIEKTVKAKDSSKAGVIRIVEYDGDAALKESIGKKLNELSALARKRNKTITVLIIGRYKYETTKVISKSDIDQWNKIHEGRLEIKTTIDEEKETSAPLDTVHKSKGLEADFVLVHSLQANRYAFPCEMEDDPLLGLSFANKEPFEFAEERRLFYVALTRAREQVVLYTSQKEPSRFVMELLGSEYGDEIHFEGKLEKPVLCKKCKQGYMQLKKNKKGKPFYGCTQFPPTRLGCTNTINI